MKLNPGATPCPHGYSGDFYCKWENPAHEWNEFPHSYSGPTKADVMAQLKRAGWTLHADNYATCPKCNKELKHG